MFATGLAVMILLLLAPGFIVVVLIDWLSILPSRKLSERIVGAFSMSLLVYASYVGVSKLVGIIPTQIILKPSETNLKELLVIPYYSPDFWSLSLIIALTLLWGLVISWILNRRFIFRILNILGISYSSETRDVWHDAFRRFHGHWGEVYLKDGTVISGWISHNSDDSTKPFLIFQQTELGDIEVMDSGENEFRSSNSNGLLLLDKDIKYVKFIEGID